MDFERVTGAVIIPSAHAGHEVILSRHDSTVRQSMQRAFWSSGEANMKFQSQIKCLPKFQAF